MLKDCVIFAGGDLRVRNETRGGETWGSVWSNVAIGSARTKIHATVYHYQN